MIHPILFIQTGGTIDKKYPQKANAYGFEIEDAAFNRILVKAQVKFDFETISLFRKDSQDITNNDRDKLLALCKQTLYKNIIITHGTDTIRETAKHLVNVDGKTIILTGAHLPECVNGSDADFNLGVSVGAINTLDNGVYIALNGLVEKIK